MGSLYCLAYGGIASRFSHAITVLSKEYSPPITRPTLSISDDASEWRKKKWGHLTPIEDEVNRRIQYLTTIDRVSHGAVG
jgi:hypothetical protein